MIFQTYSKEGERVVNSRKWLGVGHAISERFSNVHEFYQLRKTHFVWLPVDGEYPIDIPPIPIYSEWIPFSCQLPKYWTAIEIQEPSGEITKGWYMGGKGKEKHKKFDYFLPKETDEYITWWHLDDVELNKYVGYWRYVS